MALFPQLVRALAVFSILALGVISFAKPCSLCKKEIPKGQGVSAKIANSTKTYRCIHCALTDLKGKKGAYSLTVKTPLDHKSVKLSHSTAGWTQEPSTAVFLILPEHANECLDVHQPFATKSEFDRYLKLHPELAKQNPRAYTIANYERMLEAGK